MEIILGLIALVGWVVNANGWFIVPTPIIHGCVIGIFVILAIKLILWAIAKHRFNKHFKDFF